MTVSTTLQIHIRLSKMEKTKERILCIRIYFYQTYRSHQFAPCKLWQITLSILLYFQNQHGTMIR